MDLLFPGHNARQEAGVILELDTEGLRDDILVAEIQKVRALQQHVRQHEDHERIAALRHRLLHDGQELVLALHHALGVDAGDLADAEIVIGDMEILEIREQQRVGGLVVRDGRREDGLAQLVERDIGDARPCGRPCGGRRRWTSGI